MKNSTRELKSKSENLHVIIQTGDQTFAVPVSSVREMVPLPQVNTIPHTPDYIRGVVNLRGKVMPLLDLRIRLGMSSCADEAEAMVEMLGLREQDHINWLQELENAVIEKRPFKLARDPRQCAFGKWYYSYDSTTSTNRVMAIDNLLLKFENPHNHIHALADKVLDVAGKGDYDAALGMIENARNSTLAEMIKLFSEVKESVKQSRRELAMIIGENGQTAALSVDMVETVEVLDCSNSTNAHGLKIGLQDRLISNICRRTKDQSLVLKLDVMDLIKAAEAVH